jgi:UDP-N-acetyl-D-glucosamine dehydrogenase
MKQIIQSIKKRNSIIGIIGLGYVGLPLCNIFLKNKFTVYGFDIDKKKINLLKKKKIYIPNIQSNFKNFINKKFFAFNNFNAIKKVDVIIICVPTPVNKNNTPDLSPVISTIKGIIKFIKPNQLLILESSTYPGTTEQLIVNQIKKKFIIGNNYFIGYSPEREDPGNKKFPMENIPKIVSGFTNECTFLTKLLYKQVLKKIVPVSSIAVAEFAKIYENSYRSINIALANESKMLAKKLNLNIFEIINAAKTKPFGFKAFYPGPGVGGHCIPVDPWYLSWIAKKNNIKLDFLNTAGRVNKSITQWIFKNIKLELKKLNLKIEEQKLFILGAAYKKNINDLRESPTLDLIRIFQKHNISFIYNDDYIKKIESKKLKKIYFSNKLNKKNIIRNDIIVLMTDHSYYNAKLIINNSRIIFDTRNFFKTKSNKVITL